MQYNQRACEVDSAFHCLSLLVPLRSQSSFATFHWLYCEPSDQSQGRIGPAHICLWRESSKSIDLRSKTEFNKLGNKVVFETHCFVRPQMSSWKLMGTSNIPLISLVKLTFSINLKYQLCKDNINVLIIMIMTFSNYDLALRLRTSEIK